MYITGSPLTSKEEYFAISNVSPSIVLDESQSLTIESDLILNREGNDSCLITSCFEGEFSQLVLLVTTQTNFIIRKLIVTPSSNLQEIILSIYYLCPTDSFKVIFNFCGKTDGKLTFPTFNFFNEKEYETPNFPLQPVMINRPHAMDSIFIDPSEMPIKPIFKRLWIEVTSRCNLACNSCEKSTGAGGPYKDMDLELFEKSMQLFAPTAHELSITGIGEPLFHKSSKKLFDIIEQYPHLQLDFVSNGELWNNYWIERLSKIKTNVAISIDGPTEESHQYNRGTRSRLKHIQWILKEVQNRRETDPDFKLNFAINTLIMKSNVHLLPDMIEFAHEYGIKQIVFIMMGDWEGQPEGWYHKENPYVLAKEYSAIYPIIQSKANEYGIKAILPPPSPSDALEISQSNKPISASRYQFCSIPFDSVYIHWDGKISPCCAMRPYITGHVQLLDKSTLSQVLNSFKFKILQKEMLSKTYSDLCLFCDLNYGISKGAPDRSSTSSFLAKRILHHFALYNMQTEVKKVYLYGLGGIIQIVYTQLASLVNGIFGREGKDQIIHIGPHRVKPIQSASLEDGDLIILTGFAHNNAILADIKASLTNDISVDIITYDGSFTL
jgi:MoaA/NifB/PqqE/SkfB family radical SAM enzyme